MKKPTKKKRHWSDRVNMEDYDRLLFENSDLRRQLELKEYAIRLIQELLTQAHRRDL